jgi:CBS-domain-containing membrane protein
MKDHLDIRMREFNCESLLTLHLTGSKETKDAEFRLRKDILQNHSSKTLPSLNDTAPVTVTISLTLRQILDVVST